MFNKQLAGIVGQHNGHWNFRHECWRALWMKTYMNAPPEQSLDLVLWEAKKELRAIHPRYARGVVMLGGWLLVPGNESATATTTGKPVFRVTQQAMRNSTRLVFTLPEDAQVTLSIYDITGREVLSCINKNLSAGVHNYTWGLKKANGSQVATGIYLANVVATWTSKYRDSSKISVLH